MDLESCELLVKYESEGKNVRFFIKVNNVLIFLFVNFFDGYVFECLNCVEKSYM